MAFAVVLDTCVLVPPTLCDTLLRLAEAGTYRPLWSEGILSELQGVMRRQGVADALIEKRLRDMGRAFPNSTIGPSSELVSAMTCDAKDRHVLAATVRSPAQTLVTFNGRDFPLDSTEPWDVAVIDPDDFLLNQLDLHPGRTRSALVAQVATYRRPPVGMPHLLGTLSRSGVPGFADEMRRHVEEAVDRD